MRPTDVLAEDCIMGYYKLKDEEELVELPIAKKQTVYNAITRLQDKGYVVKRMETGWIKWNAPPTNFLIIKAYIDKEGKISNFKDKTEEDLKHLIGL